jgi:hypothetical protein
MIGRPKELLDHIRELILRSLCKIVRCPAYHPVEFLNDLLVKVM